ncbi:hypothetical protein D9756_008744 [Leucocoprinus leucothites]|uniref:WD repeat-containing protein JIP5 n=1 Tax=Leucocoprinus leucothites TaxID=201217 RepID=A0A8H5CYY7_9AGAR|nr:hypothetical protein D9756_008744 [Leucoagaricus leucothites]
MPEIPVDAQIFDVVFHPTFSTVYTGLLTGYVKAFAYDFQGNHKNIFSLRPSKRSCRGLSISEDGSRLYAVGRSKALHIIDTKTEQIETRTSAHESAINRVKTLTPWLLTTGDDEGVIKVVHAVTKSSIENMTHRVSVQQLWDPRQKEAVRTYTHHFDYISDFLWLEDKKQLVATSADGTLSVMDVRSKKPKPFIQSEDQEDELLSIVAIKGLGKYPLFVRPCIFAGTITNGPCVVFDLMQWHNSKAIVGTQLGILSVFNRNSGWGDCVDRIPGHPLSIDTLCNLPADLPEIDTTSTVLTGSSDGYVRAVQILPTKLLGVVADHGNWPVERIAVGGGTGTLTIDSEEANDDDEEWHGIGTEKNKVSGIAASSSDRDDNEPASGGRWWVGSVGHEDGLRLSDLMAFFRDGENADTGTMGVANDSDVEDGDSEAHGEVGDVISGIEVDIQGSKDDSQWPKPVQAAVKRKRERERASGGAKNKKGKRNAVAVDDASFFGDL